MSTSMLRRTCTGVIVAFLISGATIVNGQRGARGSARANVSRSANVGRSFNSNVNVNRDFNRNVNVNQDFNRNVNVNRDFNRNIDVDRDIDVDRNYGGWGSGCCYHPVARAAAVTAAAVTTAAVVGSVVYTLPSSCSAVSIDGLTYQQCGSTWYQPQFSGSTVNYIVVNPPR